MTPNTTDTEIALTKILAENDRRNNEIFATFDPITGEGSIGERVCVALPDFPVKQQYQFH